MFYKYFNKLVDDNRVWRIQLDTYNRELERYKSHLMELTETMFCIDSNYTLKLLNILEGMSQTARCLIAVKMVDALLIDFNCDPAGVDLVCIPLEQDIPLRLPQL